MKSIFLIVLIQLALNQHGKAQDSYPYAYADSGSSGSYGSYDSGSGNISANSSATLYGVPAYYTPQLSSQNFDDEVMTAVFKKYNKLVRPIKTVVMRIRLSLRQIVSLDEKSQTMTSNIYVSASWTDGRLKWLPYSKGPTGTSLFNNLTDLIVPATSIWTPDLFIINSAGANGFIPITSSNLAEINFKGNVFMLLSVTNLQTRCKMFVYYFPFDTQNCSIVVGAWKHSTDRINFETGVGKIDIDNYQPHPIWSLKTVVVNSIFSSDRFSPNSNETNEDIAFYFSLNRGSGYYMANLVACFILNCVTLLAYFLPFATQITLCMTSFLTFSVQSLNLNNSLPVQSLYFPLISVYFMFSIFITFFSMVWFWIMNNFITKNFIPKPLAKLAEFIQMCLFCKKKQKEAVQVKPAADKNNLTVVNLEEKKEEKTAPSTSTSQESKCNKCDMCSKCKEDKSKEDAKKKKKENTESLANALNYLVFICVCIALALLHLIIWLRNFLAI